MLFSQEHAVAPYDLDSCQMEYHYEEGLIAVPVGGGGEDAEQAIVRTHKPRSFRVVKFSIQRSGAWPTIPPPVAMNDNEVFLKTVLMPARPALGQDGNYHKFAVEGMHIFAHRRPLKPWRDNLPVGTGPEDDTAPQLSQVTPQMLDGRPLTGGQAPTQVAGLHQGIHQP